MRQLSKRHRAVCTTRNPHREACNFPCDFLPKGAHLRTAPCRRGPLQRWDRLPMDVSLSKGLLSKSLFWLAWALFFCLPIKCQPRSVCDPESLSSLGLEDPSHRAGFTNIKGLELLQMPTDVYMSPFHKPEPHYQNAPSFDPSAKAHKSLRHLDGAGLAPKSLSGSPACGHP